MKGKKIKISIGDTYNRWTVVSSEFTKVFPSGGKALFVKCDCSCGTKDKDVRVSVLTSANNPSKSCGCLTKEVALTKRQVPTIGEVYGRLEVIKDLGQVQGKSRTYNKVLVQCSCDSHPFEVSYNSIKSGHTSSCGCFNKEKNTETHVKHGKSKTKIYKVWLGIKERTGNPNSQQYYDYGGRGILNLWESFDSFLSVMESTYFDGCEIDRIDVDGHYGPGNCRWTTKSVNNHNKRKRKGCTSQYLGVCLDKNTGLYSAQLVKDGTTLFRNSYSNEQEAAKAYDDASEQYYGDRPNKTVREESL